jgi:hypothetical protein
MKLSEKLFVYGFMLGGVIIFGSGLYNGYLSVSNHFFGNIVTGKVISIEYKKTSQKGSIKVKTNHSNERNIPVVSYQVNNNTYTTNDIANDYDIGNEVSIIYPEGNPQEGRENTFRSNWSRVYSHIILGFLIFGVGFVLLKYAFKH